MSASKSTPILDENAVDAPEDVGEVVPPELMALPDGVVWHRSCNRFAVALPGEGDKRERWYQGIQKPAISH